MNIKYLDENENVSINQNISNDNTIEFYEYLKDLYLNTTNKPKLSIIKIA
ncbi:hypothetical protein ACXYRQ_02275 [Mycoplasma sp. 394]